MCAFVNDQLDEPVLSMLARGGTRLVALRSAGFNHVDLAAARALGLTVVRVPAYSPHAVAEHTVGLILALNRKLHRAYARVREGNFSLEGLLGFDLNGRTAGLVGTGKIGAICARILHGFGCRLLAPRPDARSGLPRAGHALRRARGAVARSRTSSRSIVRSPRRRATSWTRAPSPR